MRGLFRFYSKLDAFEGTGFLVEENLLWLGLLLAGFLDLSLHFLSLVFLFAYCLTWIIFWMKFWSEEVFGLEMNYGIELCELWINIIF